MKLTPVGKVVALLLVAGGAIGVWKSWSRLAPGAKEKSSTNVGLINLPATNIGQGQNASPGGSTTVSLPSQSDAPGCPSSPEVRVQGYAWNAQQGMLLATGGAQATQDSLMCQNGVNMKWSRRTTTRSCKSNSWLLLRLSKRASRIPQPDRIS